MQNSIATTKIDLQHLLKWKNIIDILLNKEKPVTEYWIWYSLVQKCVTVYDPIY